MGSSSEIDTSRCWFRLHTYIRESTVASVRKTGLGGPRPGSGRPRGSGGPPESVRRNRVVVMLTDAELATLDRMAADSGLPLGTMLYQLVKRSLRTRK